MGDSADTAREKQRARKVPKKKVDPDARAFGAATAIFVPPELQHETGPKPKPVPRKSVVLKPSKPKPETLKEKRARQARETKAREDLRIGKKIKTATGPNRLDAVPPPPPSRRIHPLGGLLSVPRYIPGTGIEWSDAGRGIEQMATGAATSIYDKATDWAGDVAAVPGNTVRALLDQSPAGPRNVPQGLAKAGRVVGQAEPLVRPLKETSEFLGTEKGQEEIWGKSLVNLALHGDTPQGKGQWAGMGLGVLGILPLGKVTQLAKLGKAARLAGRIGEALPDTPERTAWRAALSQRYGQEVADNVLLLTDNAARNVYPENPNQIYEQVKLSAGRAADFTPSGQEVRFQTHAGPRSGLVEGRSHMTAEKITLNRAYKEVLGNEQTVTFTTADGREVMLGKDLHPLSHHDDYELTIFNDDGTVDIEIVPREQAKDLLKEGMQHQIVLGYPKLEGQTAVFKQPDLVVAANKMPEQGWTAEETRRQMQSKIKPSEWSDTGMDAFLDSYPEGARIPKADVQRHLASSLNAYDLDEVILRSDSQEFAAKWAQYADGGLVVKDPTAEEPYIEIYMKLRTPLRTRTRRGVFNTSEEAAPYKGKGELHWRDKDVVGHVRMHLITDADGKKALLIDEVQSDWASEWRQVFKKAKEAGGVEARKTQIKGEIQKIQDEIERMDARGWDPDLDPDELSYQIQLLEDELHTLSGVPGPPPLGEKQMEAIVRRAVRFAEESNVDRVVVVQGDVQAIRNMGFRKTPKGRALDIHGAQDPTSGLNVSEEVEKWVADTAGMTQAEIKAYANDPAHREGMVKAFMDLYGQGDQGGRVTSTFEKVMGEKGSVRKGIFEGGFSDESRAISRQPPPDDWVIDGVKYKLDPEKPTPKPGDWVMTGEMRPGKVQEVYPNGEMTIEIDGRVSMRNLSYAPVIIPDPNAAPIRPFTQAMDGYVIEMTEGAKAKARVPMAYYQQRAWEAIPKGATEFFADGTRVIHLFENADISTIIHELSHVVLPDLQPVDRAILARHFDFSTTAGHEAYARALERYVYEGAAMTSELDGVFAKIKAWMGAVYQHVNNIGAHLHPEVKQVFDRMLVKAEKPEEQLVRLLKSAPGLRREQEAGYSVERGRRISDMFEDWPEDGGSEAFRAAMGNLKGELPKLEYTGLEDLSPEAVDYLVNAIRTSNRVRPYEKVRAAAAVTKAVDEGRVPTNSELALLGKIFGKSVGFRKVRSPTFDEILVEIVNIPRSLSASLDLSAPLRQGLVSGMRHPLIFKRNFIPMVKALRVKNYEDQTEMIVSRPNFERYQRAKLAVETHASDPAFANREEAFYSSYADKIPGVKHSSNAYSSFLHNMRADVFDHMIATAQKKGIDVDREDFLLALGRYVNSITGRGALPNTTLLPIEKMAPGLNTLFFSPRLLASRINMISPFYYGKLWRQDPFVAKQAVRAMVHTVAGAVATLAIADHMPGVDVGIDPTSANFGKIRIGDTRVDILAGFNPLMVFIAREVFAKSTSSTTGKTQNLKGGFGESTRKDIFYRFMESKLAPTAGILRDLGDQQTFIGDPVTWKSESLNFIPMMWRDAWEVGHESNDPTVGATAAAAVIVLGGLGIGFSSYPDKDPKVSGGKAPSSDELPPGWDSGPSSEIDPFEVPSDQGGLPSGW